jgi:Spy/CpxP family protein refolding chaperone
MKQQICTIALSGLLALGMTAAAASAQDAMQQQGGDAQQGSMQGPGGHHGGWGNPDEQLAHMTKRYNLTADQQSQIKPILTAQQQQMQQLHSDSSMSRQDKMAKMQSMREDSKTKIEAVLTADQKSKFEADQAKMEQRREEHMQNGGGSMSGAPAAPPQ